MSTLIELQVLAKQRGLRGFRRFSKKELCEKLNVEYTGDGCKAIPIILENVKSGDTLRFRSLYKVSIVLHKNPGSISYAIKTKKQMKVNDCDSVPAGEYTLSKENVPN